MSTFPPPVPIDDELGDIDLTEVADRFRLAPYHFESYESFMLRLTRAMVWVGMDDDPEIDYGLPTELPVPCLIKAYLSIQ